MKTGDISKAGTDANVYLVMYGNKGQTGELTLRESKTNKNKFERGKTDIFDIEASNIGQVRITLFHTLVAEHYRQIDSKPTPIFFAWLFCASSSL